MSLEKYVNGLDMKQFKHLPDISCYNYNYYVGFGKDLILGISDDEDTTEWWMITGYFESRYLGKSYISDGEKLIDYESHREW